MNRIRGYLLDLQQEIARIERFTRGGRDAFMRNEAEQYAVMRCYEIVGEIVKRLPEDLLVQHPSVEWKSVVRFRDFLIHQYDRVAVSRIWEAVEQLPALKAAIEEMLQETPDNSSD